MPIADHMCGVLCIGKDRIVEHISINNTALLLLLLILI